MTRDDFDFPEPPGFEDLEPQTARSGPKLTFQRVKLFVAVLLLGGLLATLFHGMADAHRKDPNLFGKLLARLTGNDVRSVVQRLGHKKARGDFAGALDEANRLAKLLPEHPMVHLERADLLSRLERYPQAVAAYTRAIELGIDEPMTLNNRAYMRALARMELDEAWDDVTRCLEHEPDNMPAIDTRGYLHYLFGRHEAALADFDLIIDRYEADDLGPRDAGSMGEIYFHRALALAALGRDAEASAAFGQAERLGYASSSRPAPAFDEPQPLPVIEPHEDAVVEIRPLDGEAI